jgi:hypothetical protein
MTYKSITFGEEFPKKISMRRVWIEYGDIFCKCWKTERRCWKRYRKTQYKRV